MTEEPEGLLQFILGVFGRRNETLRKAFKTLEPEEKRTVLRWLRKVRSTSERGLGEDFFDRFGAEMLIQQIAEQERREAVFEQEARRVARELKRLKRIAAACRSFLLPSLAESSPVHGALAREAAAGLACSLDGLGATVDAVMDDLQDEFTTISIRHGPSKPSKAMRLLVRKRHGYSHAEIAKAENLIPTSVAEEFRQMRRSGKLVKSPESFLDGMWVIFGYLVQEPEAVMRALAAVADHDLNRPKRRRPRSSK